VLTYVLRRLFLGVVTLYVLMTITFVMLTLTGDPVAARLRDNPSTPDQRAAIRHDMGLDEPAVVQYATYLGRMVRLDFGVSYVFQEPVLPLVLAHVPYTVALAVVASSIAFLVGIPLGAAGARWPDGPIDRLAQGFVVIGQSLPNFVIGPLTIIVFAVYLRVLPAGGASDWTSIVLPALTLSVHPTTYIARVLRGSMLEAAESDYVMVARSRGLPERVVVAKHILRNAVIPIITISGLILGSNLGGAVVVETVFGWPGVGYFLVQSLLTSDRPIVQAIVILAACTVILVNLLTDLVYAALDPRIEYGQQ